jgi:hypothetical protein
MLDEQRTAEGRGWTRDDRRWTSHEIHTTIYEIRYTNDEYGGNCGCGPESSVVEIYRIINNSKLDKTSLVDLDGIGKIRKQCNLSNL